MILSYKRQEIESTFRPENLQEACIHRHVHVHGLHRVGVGVPHAERIRDAPLEDAQFNDSVKELRNGSESCRVLKLGPGMGSTSLSTG